MAQTVSQIIEEGIEFAEKQIVEYGKWLGGVKPGHAKAQLEKLNGILHRLRLELGTPEAQAALAAGAENQVEMNGPARRLFSFAGELHVRTSGRIAPSAPPRPTNLRIIAAEGVEFYRKGDLGGYRLDYACVAYNNVTGGSW